MDYDVIILGGGINGTGTARDCAMRGLRVLLLEKADFGVGASGNSSGMIHGGIRYMLSDRHVTALACRDSGYIQRIAPHLLFRIPFLMPFASRREGATLRERATFYATEVYVGTYDLFQPLKRGKPSTRLDAEELYRLEPGLRPGLHGAVTLDEWGIDAFRLCVLNALAARGHGATIRTWTEARQVITEGGQVRGVRWRDALTGEEGESHAPVVFNAAGAWSPALARASGVKVPMRPGKGVHLTLDRRWSNYGVIVSAVDGRQMFLMPHEGESIIGTTDDDYYGDPDDLEATNDEVEYLLEGAASLVPGVRRARITRAWCGVRTTLYAYGPNEDALSREHQLLDGATQGAAGMISIVGGKLASYRAQAEEATDRIEALLGRPVTPCRTHEVPLPGGDAVPDPAALAREFPVAAPVAARVAYRHGSRARDVLGLVRDDPRLGLVLCRDEGILAAEVVWCCRHEEVRRLQDLRRRCRLAVGACGGLDCARVGAQLAGRTLSWSADRVRAELADLLDAGWRERRPVLDAAQLAQEELLRGAHGLGEVG
ncbi:glycerol-3-phosphate dehydrogenase/oxidase [Anaeromyxobacter oryzae]|uniref:Glycerol-3-phosphate dehydrogenase n=1 Tax=Anaeromyxobacter oryzae TaxID=2918170 RepID=A0ABM7WQP1_9BACT|nr:glycerol-3-phosphate dehydrogenase/oxidase [Anaeromyxobacter oryzae]BDG01796.1 glycerol-3-phosphate dehydrogenase [Anaeromyxobacter oryzae]